MTAVTSTLADRLNSVLLADPGRGREQLGALAERARTDPQLQAGAAEGLLLRPALLGDTEHSQLEQDLAKVTALLLSLPERLYGGDVGAMCDTLGFPLVHRAAVEETWHDASVVLSRTDLMRADDGFKAVEVNLHSSLGGLDSGPWHRAYLDVPMIADFVAAHRLAYVDPLDGVAGALRAASRQRGLGPFPSVAIVDWPTTYPKIEARLSRLARLFAARGFDAFACHAGELTTRGERLYARGRRVDILYRIFVIENLSQNPALLGPILTAHRAGNLVLAMSFLAELVGNKGALALLSDPANAAAFDAEELAAVARLVPWTRFVREGKIDWNGEQFDLAELTERAQDELVLKPVGGYAARDVVPGWTVDRKTWQNCIARATGRPWILQRRIRPVPELAPVLGLDRIELREFDTNWGAFLVGDRYNGMMLRAVPTRKAGVISTSSGALIGGCFFQQPHTARRPE